MKVAVKTILNEDAGSIDVRESVFACEAREDILARVVRWQQAQRRQGSRRTKGRGDIVGGKKKPWRQKGTGRARQGSINAPHFRGGSKAFGPVMRSHGHQLNKNIRRLALRMALSLRMKQEKMFVWDVLALEEGKTALLAKRLRALGITSAFIVGDDTIHENIQRASRNLPHIHVLPRQGMNVYDILHKDTLVITKQSVQHFDSILS
ncbi:MAG: 50S ribosomal protein L4 [Alphaproteobacteria bacterium GM7ARS4]|nr:50S ribosomal protein L4 [Alphaproteobacteria bacterium GM7ARS4]